MNSNTILTSLLSASGFFWNCAPMARQQEREQKEGIQRFIQPYDLQVGRLFLPAYIVGRKETRNELNLYLSCSSKMEPPKMAAPTIKSGTPEKRLLNC